MKALKEKLYKIYAKMSKRERLIALVTMIAVLAVAGDRFVLGPALRSLSQIEGNIKNEETAIRKSQYLLLRKDEIVKLKKQVSNFLSPKRSPEEEMTSLLGEIQSVAADASVNLLYVKPVSTKEIGGGMKFYANLECEAAMPDLAGLFYKVEHSPKLLKIEKFEIQPVSAKSSIARSTMTISRTVLHAGG